MSMSSIPAAPLPPKAVHVRQSPQTPLDLQHQLLYKMEQLRARSVPVAPLPPPPARLHRGIMLTDWALKDEIELAVRRMHLSHIPSAPPAPPAMRLDDNLVRSSKPLDKLIEKEAVHIHTRNQHSALSEPVVQKEFLAAAKDMHKAMAEREVPLAPAAPAPVLNAVPPLHHTISEDAAEAAKEMSRAHYPPLAPAAPAPDLITKDAMLKKPLQAQILPAAIKTMQNVEHPVMIPDAPRPPSPFKMSRGNFMMARPFKDELGLTAKQYWMNKAQTKTKMMYEAHAEFVSAPVPRAVETTLVPPPLPPRPAESLAAMAAASTTNTTTMMPMMTSTPAVVVTTAMPAMHVLAGGEQGMLESEERMGLTEVAPMMPGEKEIVIDGLTRKEKRSHKKAAERLSPNVMPRSEDTTAMTSSMSPNAANRGRRGSIGMKIKGAMKEVQGTLTRNPAKKEEGKMLLHGIDPATASTTNAGASSISNVSHA